MTLEQNTGYPRVTEILNISDTAEGGGVYKIELWVQCAEDMEPESAEYISRPDDPYGVNPQIRKWLSENPDAPVHVYVPPPPPTPEEIRESMPPLAARQLRLGLVGAGISPSEVTAVLEALPKGSEKEAAMIEWEYATSYERTHSLVATVGAGLGLTDEEIDAMWTAALSL
ncbi:hypothetical protein U8C32_12575 [Sinorhizobium medicae]|uniref:hypothetical protein n=2 Tax=Sinorhizobium medicae TaxID=110321 RepID=UPI002AF6C6E8|nr:hypothetical protein [Sinorhizobium medicae]WQO66915.1 hypothetical protein U8C40_07175 [Sinorhizobium medicae]WQO90679.1 hypothetical protein U8C32_12575 [Sinorhizobium medicae]